MKFHLKFVDLLAQLCLNELKNSGLMMKQKCIQVNYSAATELQFI